MQTVNDYNPWDDVRRILYILLFGTASILILASCNIKKAMSEKTTKCVTIDAVEHKNNTIETKDSSSSLHLYESEIEKELTLLVMTVDSTGTPRVCRMMSTREKIKGKTKIKEQTEKTNTESTTDDSVLHLKDNNSSEIQKASNKTNDLTTITKISALLLTIIVISIWIIARRVRN